MMIGAVMAGVGLLMAAGCECGCKQSACPVPQNVQKEISARMAPTQYPAMTMGTEVSLRVEKVNLP